MQPGDILADKYLVDRVLGEGGMALVVAARHLQLHQTVAIKIMRSRALAIPDALDRFLREAQTVVRLRSENVARVTDVGTLPDGTPFMVMEYLEGVDLAMVLAHRGALAVRDAVDYVLQVCAAMAEAHEAGIVHRDLKPGNLFLCQRPNGVPLVKVLDFGISKAQPEGVPAPELTATMDFGTMGSPPYMSPEQARSVKRVDERSDIWSLGVILYQLTSGRLPFIAESAAEVLAKILYSEPEPLHQVAPWVPRSFSREVMRCLNKEPEQRPATVLELIATLARFASDEGRLLVDASLLPSRRIRSLSSEAALNKPEEYDEDTQVDAASSVMVQEPERLDLGRLFAELPARTLDDAYPRTTFALYTGELSAGKGRGRRRRRALLVTGLLVAMAAIAAGVLAATGGLAPTIVPMRSVPAVETPAARASDAGVAAEAAEEAEASAEATEEAEASAAAASAAAASAAAASAEAASAAAASAAPAAGKTADERGAEPAADDGSTRKSTSKRRSTRKGVRKKSTRQPKSSEDPFGTIR